MDEPTRARFDAHARVVAAAQVAAPPFVHFTHADGIVAYVPVHGAYVVAGEPAGPPEARAAAAHAFITHARAARRRVVFFAVEQAFVEAAGLAAVQVAQLPEWTPAGFVEDLRAHRSLREQLRRARAKGVTVRTSSAHAIATDPALRGAVERVRAAWLRGRGMPPMQFLASVPSIDASDARRYLLAQRGDDVVAAATLLPLDGRDGLFVEHVYRADAAPNGTLELLLDAAIATTRAEGRAALTLGMVALADTPSRPLALVRRMTEFLYGFEGIRRTRARLRPVRWVPLFLAVPPGQSRVLSFVDLLRAFAGGGLVRFGLRTVARWLRRG